MHPVPTQPPTLAEPLKNLTYIMYGLYAATIFTGFTWLIALILYYVKKDDAVGTLYQSHFVWQVNTFWFGLLWGGLAIISKLLLVGFILWPVVIVWVLYRWIKGVVYLYDNKPMYG